MRLVYLHYFRTQFARRRSTSVRETWWTTVEKDGCPRNFTGTCEIGTWSLAACEQLFLETHALLSQNPERSTQPDTIC
jgi:hypothetical protein